MQLAFLPHQNWGQELRRSVHCQDLNFSLDNLSYCSTPIYVDIMTLSSKMAEIEYRIYRRKVDFYL